MEKRK
jgi:myosin heavy subunit